MIHVTVINTRRPYSEQPNALSRRNVDGPRSRQCGSGEVTLVSGKSNDVHFCWRVTLKDDAVKISADFEFAVTAGSEHACSTFMRGLKVDPR